MSDEDLAMSENPGNEAGGNSRQRKSSSQRGKRINDWFSNRDTQEKVVECERINQLETGKSSFIVNDGNPEYSGTYIHPMLYDHFVSWLSPKYAMRVSAILRTHHEAANLKIITAKDDKIDKLQATVDEQTLKINRLLEYGERLHGELAEVNDNVLDISHQFGQAYDVLDDIHDDLVFTSKLNQDQVDTIKNIIILLPRLLKSV